MGRLTQDDVILRLRCACAAAGGQRAWARANGLSWKWVNNVLCGRASVGPGIALALGYRRVVLFERQGGVDA